MIILYVSFGEYACTFLLGKCLRVELLIDSVGVCSTLVNALKREKLTLSPMIPVFPHPL